MTTDPLPRQITKAQLARFERAIAAAEGEQDRPVSDEDPIVRNSLLAQARRQAKELRAELRQDSSHDEHEKVH